MKNLTKYLKENKIQSIPIDNESIKIGENTYFLVQPIDGSPITDTLVLKTDFQETDFYVFFFGGRYYYSDSPESVQFNELKYIKKSESETDLRLPFLGVHGAYEILNGSREYSDWCKKANFLGVSTLGIAEKNTLAGTIKFQQTCLSAGIKPVLGATFTVYRKKEDLKYDLKVYAKNKKGWDNLLKINTEVQKNGKISECELVKLLSGTFTLFDPKTLSYDHTFPLDLSYCRYYQLDTAQYVKEKRDSGYLKNLQKYFKSDLQPVFITDAYYLDKSDRIAKSILNEISEKREPEAYNQYFKDTDDYFAELSELFSESDKFMETFEQSVSNLTHISSNCNFLIETGKKHLPKYIMNEDEKRIAKTNEDLYWHYIEQGISEKGITDKEYFDKIESEYEIINYGNLQDYFLINRDEVMWAKKNNILVGRGRGSAPSFVTTYLMGITTVNPVEHKLIPERFLTKERAKGSIADIDIDFEQERRDEVKNYLKEKYGEAQCCSVGTYGALKLKGVITDAGKIFGVDYATLKKVTKIIPSDFQDIADVMKLAVQNGFVKQFVQKHPEVFYVLPLLLNSFRNKSVHASAYMITPKEKTIHEWMPVRYEEGQLVSEWEGKELEDAGFLKADVLGLKQLSKFKAILQSIEKETGVYLDLEGVPYNDKKTFSYFGKGWNEDTFQFGSKGLSGYVKELNPKNINELIDAVALYRPGAMENNYHNEYILRKEGEREIEYLWGTKNILKNTYGLAIYQEDIMHICQEVGGFEAATSDEVRRAMGKKKLDLIAKYKKQFLNGAIKKGCPKDEAKEIWDMLKEFAKYGFNKSHSVSYATMGYWSQWIKVNYPIHFWQTAFNFANEKDIPGYITEIHKTGDIKVLPPNVNKSGSKFYADYQADTIFWGLMSVKFVGETATDQIVDDREKNGEYFSFEEFYNRHKFKGSKVTKRVYENLILSGAFDEIEGIKKLQDRYLLIQMHRELDKPKINPDKDLFEANKGKLNYRWWWVLQQKVFSGIAFFDYKSMTDEVAPEDYPFVPADEIEIESNEGKKCTVAGFVTEYERRTGKKGAYARITLEQNYEFVGVTIWASDFERVEQSITETENCIMLITGKIQYDSYRHKNILYSDSNTDVLVLS